MKLFIDPPENVRALGRTLMVGGWGAATGSATPLHQHPLETSTLFLLPVPFLYADVFDCKLK